MNDGDADGFELSDVENFVVVEIVDVTVGDEIEIGAANGAGGGKARELRAIFEDSGARDATAVVKVKAVGTGERVVRAGIYVDGGEFLQVDAEDAERVGDEECVVIGRQSDSVWIEKIAMD